MTYTKNKGGGIKVLNLNHPHYPVYICWTQQALAGYISQNDPNLAEYLRNTKASLKETLDVILNPENQ
jgi:hypothetical protein